jgi:ABC-type glycerol-3-phosphate transport system permease component
LKVYDWLRFGAAGAIALAMSFPTVWMCYSAFKSNKEIFAAPFKLPSNWSFDGFVAAWQQGNLGTLYINSLIVTVTAVAMAVLFGTAAAFGFVRLEFPGRKWMYRLLLVGLALPPAAIAISLFVQLRDMHLLDTLWALILPNAAWSLSLTVFLMRAYFESLGADAEEAARIDGANTVQILFLISIPMVWPAMLTVTIISVIGIWNELLFALLFVAEPDKRTLPAGLIRFFGQHTTDYSLIFAALSILSFPVLALYFIMQKRVMTGLTGALG